LHYGGISIFTARIATRKLCSSTWNMGTKLCSATWNMGTKLCSATWNMGTKLCSATWNLGNKYLSKLKPTGWCICRPS